MFRENEDPGALAGATGAKIIALGKGDNETSSSPSLFPQSAEAARAFEAGRQSMLRDLLDGPDAEAIIGRLGHAGAARLVLRAGVPLDGWREKFLADLTGARKVSPKQRGILAGLVRYALEFAEVDQ